MEYIRYEEVDDLIKDAKKTTYISFVLTVLISVITYLVYKHPFHSSLSVVFFIFSLTSAIVNIGCFLKIRLLKQIKPILEKNHKELNEFESKLKECVRNKEYIIKEMSQNKIQVMFMIDDYVIGYQKNEDAQQSFTKIFKNGEEDKAFSVNGIVFKIILDEVSKVIETKRKSEEQVFFLDIKDVLKSNFNESKSFEKTQKINKINEK